MGLFKRNKKDDVIDLGERYKKQQERTTQIRAENQESNSQEPQSQEAFSFLGNLASGSETQSSDYSSVSTNTEDKRKKFAKRLMEMTSKIEDLSNQIYHLQQRIEVLERKAGVGSY